MQQSCELKLRLDLESDEAMHRYRKLLRLMPRMKTVVTHREYEKMLTSLEALRIRANKTRQIFEAHMQAHACA